MADIVVSEFMADSAVEDLKKDFQLIYDPGLVDQKNALYEAVAQARALIVRNRTQVDAQLLDKAPGLQAVGRLGVGLDNIDLDACAQRGIQVFPATGANAQAVAEYAIAGMLMLFRRAYHSNDAMKNGEWPRADLQGRETGEKRLGLVGFGGIARLTARKAKALGMQVTAFDPLIQKSDPCWDQEGVTPLSFDEVLKTSDAVSLHVPLLDTTRHMIDTKALSRMKKEAVLVNTARGGIVDEEALAKALKQGQLAGAIMDVFEKEPLGNDNPFHGVPNLILTPHIAGVTHESNIRVSQVTADNIRKALSKGENQ